MIREQSYGIIPVAFREGQWCVLLVQHGRALYWGFPKGHPNEGETPMQTAEREMAEETGLHVVRYIDEKMFSTGYKYTLYGKLIDKSCGYFLAEVTGKRQIQVEEISGSQWVPVNRAEEVITHNQDRAVFSEARKIISPA